MRWVVRIGAVLLLLGILPILSVLGSTGFAAMLGCELHEGFTNPCTFLGRDIGETLYSMFVLGWFAIYTLPLAALGAIILAIAGVVRLFRRG